MRDFNFFQPFLKSTEKKNGSYLIWVVGLAACLLLMGSYQLYLSSQYNALQSDLETIEIFNGNATVAKKLSDIDKKQLFLSDLDTLVINAQTMSMAFEMKPYFDDMSMEQISAQVPEDAFIYKIELTPEMVRLTGYAKSYESLSQTVFNLKKIIGFENLSLSSVKDMENQLQFIMESSLGNGGSIE